MRPSRPRPYPYAVLTRLVLLVLVLCALAGGVPARAESQAGQTYFISGVNSSKFPAVQFTLRALDGGNHAAAGLSAANLPVYEDGKLVPAQNVQVTAHDDGPLTVAFVVDEGAKSSYAALVPVLRQAIGQLVSGGTFVDGRDRVELAVRENPGGGDRTSLRLGPTTRGQDLLDFLSGYSFQAGSGPTKGLQGVADIVTQLGRVVTQPGTQDAVIIFISRAIEDPAGNVATTAAQNNAAEAASHYITVHAVQASVNLPDQDPLKALAGSGNGQFVKLSPTSAGALDGIYQALGAQRVYYTVSYTSPYSGTAPRLITVGAPDKSAAGTTGQYQVDVAPPLVTLDVQPTSLRRDPIPGATGPNPYGPASVRAAVNIGWTDGITRALHSVELYVNDVMKDEKTALQLPMGTTHVELVADLSDMTTPGTSTANLKVTVEDALGNQVSAQQSVQVEVMAVVTPTATPDVGSTFSIDNPLVLVAIALGAVLLVLAAVLVVVLMRRKSPAGGTQGPPALATLYVLKGPGRMMNKPIHLVRSRAVLGRDPTATDVTFYAGEPSSISRVHAILEYDDTRGFVLTDKGSANGTCVNGQRLGANTPQPVRDGDELVLGDLSRKGVKLRFAMGKGERWVGGVDDRTRIGL